MNTEITDNIKISGWVGYDADCRFCTHLARRFAGTLARRHFQLVPLQTPWVRARLAALGPAWLEEMRLLKPDGTIHGGADALLEISRQFWWAWPLRQLGRLPLGMSLVRAGYRWVARRRNCAAGACKLEAGAGTAPAKKPASTRRRLFDFLPLLLLPLLAWTCQRQLAPWQFMWTMALALYAGCKWLTFRLATGAMPARPDPLRAAGYLLAWPGMNAAEFLDPQRRAAKPEKMEWLFALAKTLFGATLLWLVTRLAAPVNPLLAGWTGMIGVIFLLHFGWFHLLSLAWRRAGVQAPPLMQNPLRASSPAEFWGARWNTAFNELAVRLMFRPLRRRTTPAVATLAIFTWSGLIHEMVISLPAQGGYGLPTLYFLIQGLGVITTHRSAGGPPASPWRGWLLTLLLTAGSACWLFHPPFIHHVILPMLAAIGAT